jgi:hypothetical protein
MPQNVALYPSMVALHTPALALQVHVAQSRLSLTEV